MNRVSLTVALTATVLAAGCGGSDFREEAQAVCTRYAQQLDGVDRPADLRELGETSGRIADLITAQVGELRALDAPGERAADFERWLKLTTEAAANARAVQEAARANEQPRVNELAGEAARNTLSADRLARDLQLPDCMIESGDA